MNISTTIRGILVAAALLSASTATAAISPRQIEAAAAKVDANVIAWRRDIHQQPELSNREFRTAALVAEHLRRLGLEVKTGIAHTGVAAILRGGRPGPTIALRADMDALPVTEQVDLPFKSTVKAEYLGKEVGVMHACGHDAHTAILMGVAQALASWRKELPGTVLFVFQPAEEGAPEGEEGGASLMLKEGLFSLARPEAMFGLHVFAGLPAGAIRYRSGPLMAASDSYSIVVSGRQTHGSRPWAGVDPIVAASQIVMGLQTIVSRQVDITELPVVVTVGKIDGGVRHNIIPDRVEMHGTIRTFDPTVRSDVIERMRHTAQDIASSSGATATLTMGNANPVVENDPALTERVVPWLQDAIGEGRVRTAPLQTGAEDFAFYANEVPSFFFFLGITPPDADVEQAPSNHSPLFYIHEPAIGTGTRAMLTLAVGYLQGR